jgi:hypothetical protein
MADGRSERPIDPRISPYLRRSLRTLKEAEQDCDAARRHSISVSSPADPTSPDDEDVTSPRKQPLKAARAAAEES